MQRSGRARVALDDSDNVDDNDNDSAQSYVSGGRDSNGDNDSDSEQLLLRPHRHGKTESRDASNCIDNGAADSTVSVHDALEATASQRTDINSNSELTTDTRAITSNIDDNDDDDDDLAFWDADDGNDTGTLALPRPAATYADHSIIDVLADELRQRAIPAYMEAFEIVIPDAEVVVGTVPVHELEQREQDVEAANLRRAELESALYRDRESHIAVQEAQARERLVFEARKRHERLEREQRQLISAVELRARRLRFVLAQAESHLTSELTRQQADVETRYGRLAHSRIPQSRKRFRVAWQRIPVLLELHVRQLRAVKDKLPAGHYVLVATLYDRLGGHALHYSAWDPETSTGRKSNDRIRDIRSDSDTVGSQIRLGKPNFTRPFMHRGRFYHTDVVVNQSVFVACPPECALRPGNVLVFELFRLAPASRSRSKSKQQMQPSDDQVVAWGALPLSTPDRTIVMGKFKVPLLRGEMDPTMDKFRDIECTIASDLSAWLCNLYVDITHVRKRLPRSHTTDDDSDFDDYDVEIDDRTGLMRVENNYQRYMRKLTTSRAGLKSRTHVLQDDDDDSDGGLGAAHTATEPATQLRSRRTSAASSAGMNGGSHVLAGANGSAAGPATLFPSSRTLLLDGSESGTDEQHHQRRCDRKQHKTLPPALASVRRAWRRLVSPKKSARVYSGEIATEKPKRFVDEASDSELLAPVLERSASQSQQQRTTHSAFASSAVTESDDRDVIDNDAPEALDTENYRFSVNDAASVETAQHRRFHMQRKLYYLRHELLTDLGAANVWTLEFWRFAALLVAALWLRVYVHYVTQWLWLRGNRVPVYDFRTHWTTCVVKYTARSVSTTTELGAVAAGVVGNVALFAFLAAAAAVSQTFVGELPHVASTFTVCVGIVAVLDPYVVLLVDIAQHRYGCNSYSISKTNSEVTEVATACAESLASTACSCVDGDAFKLYVRFYAQEGSGVVGAALTLMLYAALTCIALAVVYAYVLHVHMNGRMLDVYRRIHGAEDAFFVPHDREVALSELLAVCAHAQRWKGPSGLQRKVFVHAYTLVDPLDATFAETNVHVAIYTIELDGARELHRHFLKAPDGAILELFGAIGTGRDGAWLNSAHATAATLALLHTILQDQQSGAGVASSSAAEASPEHLATLFAAL